MTPKLDAEHPMVGKRVQLQGTPRPDMNGLLGTCTGYVAEADRYVVKIDKKGKSGAPLRAKLEWLAEATASDEEAASSASSKSISVFEQLGVGV